MEDVLLQDNLSMIEQSIWLMLERGVASYRAAFHYGTIATVNQNIPELRTVILRDAKTSQHKLSFHTDVRSSKTEQIKFNSNIAFLFYDPELRIQLRCSGRASVHHLDEVAAAAWHKSRLSSQLCYTNQLPPGAFVSEPVFIDLSRKEVAAEELNIAYQHFALIEIDVKKIDWLFLHHKGHRRAVFDYQGDVFHWVQP
jgi:hypothetical protein